MTPSEAHATKLANVPDDGLAACIESLAEACFSHVRCTRPIWSYVCDAISWPSSVMRTHKYELLLRHWHVFVRTSSIYWCTAIEE